MSSNPRPTITPGDRGTRRDLHLFMRLAREWDLRFERVLRAGEIKKWFSAVGNEAVTVAAAGALERGDALLTLHRDSGAILRHYFRAASIEALLDAPGSTPTVAGTGEQDAADDLLYRLACQVLGRADGFSGGFERSYHYNLLRPDDGISHVGMVSHIGAMVPVAAGVAFALRREGQRRVALNFIGDGGTSTGDFHEGLNMAAVLRVPLVLVVENNGFAISTPTSEQYACETLAQRGQGYGIPGVEIDGADPERVFAEVGRAVARARSGGGPSLIEARIPRLRGHSEGDTSASIVATGPVGDPLAEFERSLVRRGEATERELAELGARISRLVLAVVERALACPPPAAASRRPVHGD